MAIYSLSVRSIGRRTHTPGSAAAHIRYISRKQAQPVLFGQHIEAQPRAAQRFFNEHESQVRSNGRIASKIMIPLPREVAPEFRAELVQRFMDDISGGAVPWYAAIHQAGKDVANPHVHIILCDKHLETGARVLCLSDSPRDWKKKKRPGDNPVSWLRARWSTIANDYFGAAGIAARIDHRSLKDQGIDRKPGLHVGPKAAAAARKGVVPQSRDQPVSHPSLKFAWRGQKPVPYASEIDEGRSRAQVQAERSETQERTYRAALKALYRNFLQNRAERLEAARAAGAADPAATVSQELRAAERELAARHGGVSDQQWGMTAQSDHDPDQHVRPDPEEEHWRRR